MTQVGDVALATKSNPSAELDPSMNYRLMCGWIHRPARLSSPHRSGVRDGTDYLIGCSKVLTIVCETRYTGVSVSWGPNADND